MKFLNFMLLSFPNERSWFKFSTTVLHSFPVVFQEKRANFRRGRGRGRGRGREDNLQWIARPYSIGFWIDFDFYEGGFQKTPKQGFGQANCKISLWPRRICRWNTEEKRKKAKAKAKAKEIHTPFWIEDFMFQKRKTRIEKVCSTSSSIPMPSRSPKSESAFCWLFSGFGEKQTRIFWVALFNSLM